MQTSTTSVIGYGKLPVHGDFVRHNASGSALRALDEWLQRGLYAAKTRMGGAFETAYDELPAYRFVFAPDEADPPLIGVLRPSRDRSSRTYPFLIAFENEQANLDPQNIIDAPVRFANFLDQAAELAREVVDGQVGHRDIGERLDTSGLSAAAENGSPDGYERYLGETSLGTWCSRYWGHFDDSRKYLLFRNLFELVAPLKGDVPRGFTLGLKFPVGPVGASELAVAFWIDMCMRLLGHTAVTPVFFWSAAESDGGRGSLSLFFRLPPPRVLIHLLGDDAAGDHLCDLETMGGGNAAEAALAIPPHLGALLESEEISLRDFLARI